MASWQERVALGELVCPVQWFGVWGGGKRDQIESCCVAPSARAAPRRSCSSFCGRGKVGGDNNRLLRDESIESCLTEQRCSVDLLCVIFNFFCYLSDL